MSLLTEASLIVTPNAYKAGTLYSVIPNTTLGDMTVVRATSATRVNSAGLIEIARTNLVLYSEQFDNIYWGKTLGGVASAPVVTPNVETAPDGTTTADRVVFNLNGGTLATDISQLESALFSSVSITRTQSVYIKTTDGTTKVFTFVSPTGAATSITVTSVYQRFTWTSTGINAGTIRLRLRGSASGEGTSTSATIAIWGAQYEDGSVATEYIPTVASIRTKFAGITQDGSSASNIPRLDYPPLGGCPSILVEPQRTNLALRSQEFDNAAWTKNSVIVTANAAISPEGYANAEKLISTAVSGFHSMSQLFSKSALTPYTFSFFAKADEIGFCIPSFSSSFSGTQLLAQVNLTNGTVASVSAGLSASTQNYGNGWFRVILTATSQNNTIDFTATINTTDAAGNASHTGNGTSGILIYGAQMEAGSNATSYIPTVAATVTRNADVISKTGVSSLIGQTEGTVFVELNLTNVGSRAIFTLDIGATTNYIASTTNSTNAVRLVVSSAGSATTLITTSTLAIGFYKIAFAYKSGDYAIYINGVSSGTSLSTTFPIGTLSQFVLSNASYGALNDSYNLATVFPTRLTNAQLATLTTL
jgi:hypothetical protein